MTGVGTTTLAEPKGAWLTEANLVRARLLWDEGLVVREIAAAIGCGCTKDAIVGCAHRKNWPPRPSPIRRGGEVPVAVPRVPDKPHRKGGRKRKACRPIPTPPKPVVVAPVPTMQFGGCQWTDSLGRPWVFCGAPVVRGGAWCEEHRARVYVRPPRWLRAEAA